jgi:hypothetical protein
MEHDSKVFKKLPETVEIKPQKIPDPEPIKTEQIK